MSSRTRVRAVCLDVAAPAAAFAAAGLAPGSADCVLMNPPFNAPQNPSPDRGRRVARTASPETLAVWLSTAARLLRPFRCRDADLACRRAWRCACGAGCGFRRGLGLANPSQAGLAGDPRAGARRKAPQRAAVAAVRICARRRRRQTERSGGRRATRRCSPSIPGKLSAERYEVLMTGTNSGFRRDCCSALRHHAGSESGGPARLSSLRCGSEYRKDQQIR